MSRPFRGAHANRPRPPVDSAEEADLNESVASPSLDRADIGSVAGAWSQLDLWYSEGPGGMKASAYRLSEPLARTAREYRALGRKRLCLKEGSARFALNVGPPEAVRPGELTRARFFALLLRYLHEAARSHADPESAGFVTPRPVRRVDFDEANPLYEYRFLLGEGFHLNLDAFEAEGTRGRVLFLFGCLLLDFLPLRRWRADDFEKYVGSEEALRGGTLVAAARVGVSPDPQGADLSAFRAMARLCRILPPGDDDADNRAVVFADHWNWDL